jgi:hypothetical protein
MPNVSSGDSGDSSVSTQPGDGQILDQRPQPTTQPLLVESSMLVNLIYDASASDNSPWVHINPYSNFALEVTQVSGDGTFSLQLVGSCALEQPSSGGSNLGSAVTDAGISFPSLKAVRWLQAQLTISGTAVINVNLNCTAP